jgi:hypothetical protein
MEQSSIQNSGARVGLSSVNDPVIHTMPKRFINSKEERGTSHKGAGLLILGVGALILATGAIFVYFYVFNEPTAPNQPLVQTVTDTSKISEKATTTQSPEQDSSHVQIADDTKTQVIEATNTPVEASNTPSIDQSGISSSSEEADTATKTVKVINASADQAKMAYSLAPDADQDGLSDTEEIIFGTSPNSKDTDNDGYADLAEIGNQYNPAGEGTLILDPGIKKYTDATAGYSLYYPAIWQISSIDSGNTVVFQIDGMEYIQVVVSDKTAGQNFDDWYKEKYGVSAIKGEQRVYKKGWLGIKSEDRLMYFLSDGQSDKVFTFDYVLGGKTMLSYKSIFDMMVNTFEIK